MWRMSFLVRRTHPTYSLCTDNAAMVASLGYRLLMANERLNLTGDVFSRG